MTPQEVRELIADAASTVAGISCTPYFRQSTKTGDGMVRLDHNDYPDRFGGLSTWQVLVVLPQDIASAEKYLDSKIPDLVTALSEALVVRRVTPQELALDNGTRLPVVVIEGIRESD